MREIRFHPFAAVAVQNAADRRQIRPVAEMRRGQIADDEIRFPADQVIDIRQIQLRQQPVLRIEKDRPFQNDAQFRQSLFDFGDNRQIRKNGRVRRRQHHHRAPAIRQIGQHIVERQVFRLIIL